MFRPQIIRVALASLFLCMGTGCDSLLHNLKPHRLWQLNRHSPPMASGSSPYYSVPDPPLERAFSSEVEQTVQSESEPAAPSF